MRLYLVVPGILLALAGFVFTLQGLGIVGPTSSFMFQSIDMDILMVSLSSSWGCS